MKAPECLLLFENVTDAETYRNEMKSGGWIFVPTKESANKQVVLFPMRWTASMILEHWLIAGRPGNLISHR